MYVHLFCTHTYYPYQVNLSQDTFKKKTLFFGMHKTYFKNRRCISIPQTTAPSSAVSILYHIVIFITLSLCSHSEHTNFNSVANVVHFLAFLLFPLCIFSKNSKFDHRGKNVVEFFFKYYAKASKFCGKTIVMK